MRNLLRSQTASRHQELRLNCSAAGNYVDPFGLTWLSDNTFIGVGVTVSGQQNATNTVYPALFNTLRYNPGGFTYNLEMDNGLYALHFFWSETFYTLPGEKVFGLAIQGQTVLENFDLIKEAGGQNIALSRIFKAIVTNRNLEINFLPGSADHPSISAICISKRESLRQSTGAPVFNVVVSIQIPVVNKAINTISLNLPLLGSTYRVAIISATSNPRNKTEIAVSGAQFPGNSYSNSQTVSDGFSGSLSVIPYLTLGQSYKIVAANDSRAFFSPVFVV